MFKKPDCKFRLKGTPLHSRHSGGHDRNIDFSDQSPFPLGPRGLNLRAGEDFASIGLRDLNILRGRAQRLQKFYSGASHFFPGWQNGGHGCKTDMSDAAINRKKVTRSRGFLVMTGHAGVSPRTVGHAPRGWSIAV